MRQLLTWCVALCFIVSTWSIAPQYDAPSSGGRINNGNRQAILDLHNEYRAKIARGEIDNQPAAANMQALSWDDRLEASATGWVNKCIWDHDSGEQRRTEPYRHVGQNLAGESEGRGFFKSTFDGWFREYKGYHFYDKECSNRPCGHYTQIAWGGTKLVGCGYDSCNGRSNMKHVVCNYAPGGNMGGEHLYKIGTPCTKCPAGYNFCMSAGLCATEDQCQASRSKCECLMDSRKCSAHGTPYSSKCKCRCDNGWSGINCEDRCSDALSWCHQQSHNCRWSSIYAGFLLQNCTRTCGWCDGLIDEHAINSQSVTVNAEISSAESATGVDNHRAEETNSKYDNGDDDRNEVAGSVRSSVCTDQWSSQMCAAYRSKGYCTVYLKEMETNCCETCASNAETAVVCKNLQSDSLCSAWKSAGYCHDGRYERYMKLMCCDTCAAM